MNTVIYARYSAGPRQTDQSIEGQLRVCTDFCKQRGLTVIDTYCDRHISGRTDERPEFQRLIADAKRKKFEAVVVYKTDRFARNKYDSAVYKRELKRIGIQIFYAAEAIPDGPEGIILESLMEGLAEYYSAELAQKIKRGMHESALKCQSTGSGRPLGYRVDEQKHFQIDPESAQTVQTIFEQYIKGESNAAICELLNSRGLRTAQGKPFNKNSINRIIKNRKYIGEYRYHDIVVEGGMPAIISKDTFNLAQAEMERRRTRKAPKSPKAEYLLAGRLFCGHCKGPMQGVSGTGKSGNKWYYYYCGNTRGKNKTCDKKQVSRDRLERAVVDFTVRYILQEDVLEELARKVHAAQERQNDTASEVAFYEKKLADNKKSIANVLRAIESGAATQTLPARLQELENEQAVILGELSFLKGKHLAFTEDQILFALMKHLEPYPGESEQDYRRRIISDFVSEVYLYDDRLLIYFNISSEDGKLKSADLSNIEGGEFDEGLVSSTKMKTVRKGGFHFAVGLRESKFIPPCGGNPFRSTKNKPPARVALFLLRPANAMPHCASCCALPRAVVYCTYLSPHRLHKGGLPVSTMLERRYRRQHLNCVRHITLDPKGRGVVRIHMIPPREDAENAPFLLLLNGSKLVPLNLSWAILLSCFMDRLEPFAGLEITESDWNAMAAGAVARTHKVYPFTSKERLAEDLQIMIESLVAIARGQEPEAEVAPLTLGEYAPEMTAPHRMDLMVSAMTRDGAWHCNQKCLHCYAAGQPLSDTPELTTAQWKEVLDRLRAANIPQVTFTGGEPTLRADLVELVDAAQWFVTRLNTNGRLLTPALCQKLYDASLDSVQVTLYSHDKDIHNALVGADGFDDTVAGIRAAVAAGLSVSVNTPLCSLNTAYDEMLRFVHGLGVRYVTCSGLIPSGGAVGDESRATALTEQQLTDVLTKAVAVAEELEMEMDFTSPGWLKEETLRALGLTLVPSCGACLSNMAVAPDGGVIPCQSWLSSQPLGNILADDWDKIWQSERCAAIRAKSAKMEQLCQLRESNREEGTLC